MKYTIASLATAAMPLVACGRSEQVADDRLDLSKEVLEHFDHGIALIGADHVGIGPDFDGEGDSHPIGRKDVSGYPILIDGLLRRGYSEEDIRKILGENLTVPLQSCRATCHDGNLKV
jgi:microsomal dipeptidase-like Zn-dependent dipeptidase